MFRRIALLAAVGWLGGLGTAARAQGPGAVPGGWAPGFGYQSLGGFGSAQVLGGFNAGDPATGLLGFNPYGGFGGGGGFNPYGGFATPLGVAMPAPPLTVNATGPLIRAVRHAPKRGRLAR
jgi:hypothetical protein